MRAAVLRFIGRIEAAGPQSLAFFYYSGHGAALPNRSRRKLHHSSWRLDYNRRAALSGGAFADQRGQKLGELPAKARFVIVDACRSVAFSLGSKGATKGLVPIQTGNNLLIEFATKPGRYALDDGRFARTLAEQIRQPRTTGRDVLFRTQKAVAEATSEEQVPWIEGVLLKDVMFNEGDQIAPYRRFAQSGCAFSGFGSGLRGLPPVDCAAGG